MSTSESGSPSFDMSAMSAGTKIAGGSAIVLLVSTFLAWVHVDVGIAGFKAGGSASGFGEYLGGKLTALIAAAVIVLIVIEVRQMKVTLPVPAPLAIAGGGALAFLLAGFHIFSQPGGGFDGAGVDIGPSYGVFIATVAAAGVAFGGWKKMSE